MGVNMVFKEKIKNIFLEKGNQSKKNSSIKEDVNAPIIHIVSCIQESEKIAIELMQAKPVIINLTNISTNDKYRIIDFLSGVIFSLQGRRIKLEKNIYLFVR